MFGGFSLDQFLFLPIGVAAFVALLTLIVFVHEYGHFSVARALGIRVDIFSIGFGKPLCAWTDKKGTEWRIAMLPFGGYVKFFGDAGPASNAAASVAEQAEREHAQLATTQFPRPGQNDAVGDGLTPEEKKVCFHFKPVWARAAVVAAGPIANFILAVVIFWGLMMAFGVRDWAPRIAEVLEESAAAEAGFEPGDLIVAIDGKPVEAFQDLQMAVMLSAGDPLRFAIERNGARQDIVATPRRQEREDAFGNTTRVGVLGVRPDPAAVIFKTYNPVEAVGAAVDRVREIIATTLKFLGRLMFGKEDPRQLGGPIKIAQYAGQSALSGFDESAYEDNLPFSTRLKISLAAFINLAAVVSVSIGFLNLLPIPVLDGGHLLYYAYEAVAGKPLGLRAQEVGFRLGLVFLASFMVFVTWNDISALVFG